MNTVFCGEVKKITLSNYPCYFIGPPELGDPMEQKVTINCSGSVSVTSTDFSSFYEKVHSGTWRKTNVGKGTAKDLLNKISEPFRITYNAVFATDVGSWEITITDMDGKEYKANGCIVDERFDDISFLIRNTLQMEDLLCFDGRTGYKPVDDEE